MVSNDSMSKLRKLVEGFQAALVAHDFSDTGLNLRNFPVECCHHACKLLTVFLFEQGFTDIEKRAGSRPDDPTGQHLWLIVEGAIVDITAYQFDERLDEKIVTMDSAWHTPLEGKPSHFGLKGESLGEYVIRAKSHYKGLCEQLELEALRIISQ
jgi:hypothetical protein